jgi:hypothetical protein
MRKPDLLERDGTHIPVHDALLVLSEQLVRTFGKSRGSFPCNFPRGWIPLSVSMLLRHNVIYELVGLACMFWKPGLVGYAESLWKDPPE